MKINTYTIYIFPLQSGWRRFWTILNCFCRCFCLHSRNNVKKPEHNCQSVTHNLTWVLFKGDDRSVQCSTTECKLQRAMMTTTTMYIVYADDDPHPKNENSPYMSYCFTAQKFLLLHYQGWCTRRQHIKEKETESFWGISFFLFITFESFFLDLP